MSVNIPGWEGSVGPLPAQYSEQHVYARDIHSGAGNCVCGSALGDGCHVQAAPGIPIPDRMRTERDRVRMRLRSPEFLEPQS